jgi:murein DD-endopeptidase MepM/ murein hydrolase activator NlpD
MVAIGVAAVLALMSGSPALAGGPPCLLPPVSGTVTDPFRSPDCTYCAGNRGLEIATSAGSAVVAAAAGTVSFAGLVAGTRYVVVDHGGGYRTTYGKLRSAAVGVGDRVSAGQTVGSASSVTFFGLRLGDTYLDPAPHLAVAEPRPQLVPLDGTNRRAPLSPRVSC